MALTSTEEAQLRQLLDQQSELLTLAAQQSTISSKLSATKKNLSQLTAATSLNYADITFLRQGTSDRNASLQQVYDKFEPDIQSLIDASLPADLTLSQNVVTESRALGSGSPYTNNTGYAKFVSVIISITPGQSATLVSDGIGISSFGNVSGTNTTGFTVSGWIPDGAQYYATASGASTLTTWIEWDYA